MKFSRGAFSRPPSSRREEQEAVQAALPAGLRWRAESPAGWRDVAAACSTGSFGSSRVGVRVAAGEEGRAARRRYYDIMIILDQYV